MVLQELHGSKYREMSFYVPWQKHTKWNFQGTIMNNSEDKKYQVLL